MVGCGTRLSLQSQILFQCSAHVHVLAIYVFWRIKLRERERISFVDVLWGARLARRGRTTLVIAEFDGWNTLRKYTGTTLHTVRPLVSTNPWMFACAWIVLSRRACCDRRR